MASRAALSIEAFVEKPRPKGLAVSMSDAGPNGSDRWGWFGKRMATVLTGAGLARQRVQFPWFWLLPIRALPLALAMVESLAAGGITHVAHLIRLLNSDAPLAAPVRELLRGWLERLGASELDHVPGWWFDHLPEIDTAFGDLAADRGIVFLCGVLPIAPMADVAIPEMRLAKQVAEPANSVEWSEGSSAVPGNVPDPLRTKLLTPAPVPHVSRVRRAETPAGVSWLWLLPAESLASRGLATTAFYLTTPAMGLDAEA